MEAAPQDWDADAVRLEAGKGINKSVMDKYVIGYEFNMATLVTLVSLANGKAT
jgi:hypothetical protein